MANIRTRLACQIPNGFELVKTSTVDDLKLDLTEMTHTASGARWIHIDKPSEKQKAALDQARPTIFVKGRVNKIRLS